MKHYRQPDVDRRHFLWTAAAAGAFPFSRAQRVAAQDALTTEILVNTTTVGIQDQATVAPLVASRQRARDDGFSNRQFTATSERWISCSSPGVAPLPGGRFLPSWIQKTAETFSTSPTVRARVLSAGQGRLAEEVQANSAVAPNRFNAAATTIFSPGESEMAFVTWDDDSRSGGDASDTAVHGRSLRITSAGL